MNEVEDFIADTSDFHLIGKVLIRNSSRMGAIGSYPEEDFGLWMVAEVQIEKRKDPEERASFRHMYELALDGANVPKDDAGCWIALEAWCRIERLIRERDPSDH